MKTYLYLEMQLNSLNSWYNRFNKIGIMTAEGMFYVLAFRAAKMSQKLRPFENSCNRIGKCTEFSENIPKVEKVCKKL